MTKFLLKNSRLYTGEKEDIDENYEPTDEEILEYAKFLGMDQSKD